MFPASTEGLDMDIPIDQEPPYVGLTYESFLSPKYVKPLAEINRVRGL